MQRGQWAPSRWQGQRRPPFTTRAPCHRCAAGPGFGPDSAALRQLGWPTARSKSPRACMNSPSPNPDGTTTKFNEPGLLLTDALVEQLAALVAEQATGPNGRAAARCRPACPTTSTPRLLVASVGREGGRRHLTSQRCPGRQLSRRGARTCSNPTSDELAAHRRRRRTTEAAKAGPSEWSAPPRAARSIEASEP